MMNEGVTFEKVSEFLVQYTDGKIPFLEGAMTSAALVARRDELKAEMEKKRAQKRISMEIIGFKENPVQIMEGALDFPQAPKYPADFDPQKHPDIVDTLLDLISGHGFVLNVRGRFLNR
jgi:hypothetical protein